MRTLNKQFLLDLTDLANRADKEDAKAIKEFSKLMKDKKAIEKKLDTSFEFGGEITRSYDVNINSGVGTYAKGGEVQDEEDYGIEYTCDNETCRKYYSGDYNSGYCSEDCRDESGYAKGGEISLTKQVKNYIDTLGEEDLISMRNELGRELDKGILDKSKYKDELSYLNNRIGKSMYAKGGLLNFDVLVDDKPLIQISEDDFLETYNVSYYQKDKIPQSTLNVLNNRKELTREETIDVLKKLRNDKNVKIDVPLPFAKGGITSQNYQASFSQNDMRKYLGRRLTSNEREQLAYINELVEQANEYSYAINNQNENDLIPYRDMALKQAYIMVDNLQIGKYK